MSMDVKQYLQGKAKKNPKKVVFPELGEPTRAIVAI